MKKFLLGLSIAILCGANIVVPVMAIDANNDFEVIPQASGDVVIDAVDEVGSKGGHVRDIYNDRAQEMNGQVGNQLASGIMTRDTLLDYVVYLVRFLSQVGLVIGALMIIYAGYKYATTIFSGGGGSDGKKSIIDAIIGILIIAFSYAIMKLLTSALIS